MAVITEQVSETRVRHYSDTYHKLRQIETGIIYEDAEDNIPCRYTYEEVDEMIPDVDIDDSEALNIITRGDVQ